MHPKFDIAEIFRAAGTGTRAYSLRNGPVTYAGHRKSLDGTVLLFMPASGGPMLQYDTKGIPEGEDVPDLVPTEGSAWEADWTALYNLLRVQEDILASGIDSYGTLMELKVRNASLVAYGERLYARAPSSVGGRLMKRFADAFGDKTEEAGRLFPKLKKAKKKKDREKRREKTTVSGAEAPKRALPAGPERR